METSATLDAPCPPGELFHHVEALHRYPAWIDLVHSAAIAAGTDDVWDTELRARIGPFARSKRLRMRRTVHDPATGTVRFERDEVDGRAHAPWLLSAHVDAVGGGSRLTMRLAYGGRLWTGGLLERALDEQISRGRARLLALTSPTR